VASRCRPFARITRKRASALKDAKQVASCNTSAERSEAREDGGGRNSSSRVASPLVMATRGKEARFDDVRLAHCACSQRKPLPPASQGGSATRNDRRHRRQPLRLRPAPPSATPLSPQVASARHSRGRRCGSSRIGAVAAAAAPSGDIHATASKSGGREPKVRPAASCERASFLRSPLRRLPLAISTPQRAKAADANQRFAPPQVASAHSTVTDFARLRGLSTSLPRMTAA
jgi:hypothetical protein